MLATRIVAEVVPQVQGEVDAVLRRGAVAVDVEGQCLVGGVVGEVAEARLQILSACR